MPIRRIIRGAVALGVALSLTPLPRAAGQPPPAAGLTDFDPARDWPLFPKLFREYGSRPDRSVVVSPDGLEFRLGPRPEPGHAGVRADVLWPGEFDVGLKFDLLTVPAEAPQGYGVMVGLRVETEPDLGGATATRGTFREHGPRFAAGRSIPLGKTVHYASRLFPAGATNGRLALRRVGSDEVIMLGADGADGELQELARYPFPNRPVRSLQVYADTGGAAAELRVRVSDLWIRTGDAVPRINAPKGPPGLTLNPLATPDAAPTGVTTLPPPAGVPWWVPLVTFVAGMVTGVSLWGWRQALPAARRTAG